MRQTIISLIRKARYTLETQWSIDPEHLRACQSFFSYAEALLNHEDSRFEEEYEEDGDSYTYNFKYSSPNGRFEYHAVTLHDYNDGPALQFYYSIRASRNDPKTTYVWDANFDEKKQLYFIGVQKDDGDIRNRETLWAYKYNRRFR